MQLLTSLQVKNYRLFESLDVEGLTRVNLFVGKNNAGKTALLEAISILVATDFPYPLYRSSIERFEDTVDPKLRPGTLVFDARNWFRGYEISDGSSIRVQGTRPGMAFVECAIRRREGPARSRR